MQRRISTLLSIALGAILIAAPSISKLGADISYDQALAAKGGNGKGNGNGGKSGASGKSAKGSSTTSDDTTSVATVAKTKQKTSAKQLALSDPLAPAHPSMLGRWNAAKPIDHPAIQAHIRNGKFNGTIGMVAAYAYAQSMYNSMDADLAAAQGTLAGIDMTALETSLSTALTAAGYADLASYEAAMEVEGALPDTAVEAVKAEMQTYADAEAIVAAGQLALDDLAAAEANMEAYSNRAPWSDIRDDVRTKMGLDPAENDLVTEAAVTDPVEPTEPSEPDPVIEPAP